MTPEEARKAFEQYGSIRAASKATNTPRTTFRRKLEKSGSISKKTVLFLADIHSPYQDDNALNIAIDFTKKNFDITHLVLGGDLADFYQISRFLKNKQERMSFPDEIKHTQELLKKLADEFYGCDKIFIKGNHEDRLERYLMQNAPDLIGIKGNSLYEMLKIDNFKYIDNIKLLEETGKPFSIGELYYLHGHEINTVGAVNLARSKFLKVNSNIIFGHHHQTQSYMHKCFNTVKGAWSVGCLCTTNPAYFSVNQHIQGFAVIDYESDNTFCVHNKMIIDNKVH